jgi:protein-S-isoprenylcysteine O-methyltransferase Ste14
MQIARDVSVVTIMSRAFVWVGGVLFVASLACCLWLYLMILGQPAPSGAWPALAADILLIGLFATHHSVCARAPVKALMTRAVPDTLERSVYVWIASALLILVCLAWRRVGGTVYTVTGWRAAAHDGLQVFGVALIAWSVAGIDPLELAGIRHQRQRGGLQTAGPYGWVRHPLYFGWVLAAFGAAHMTGDRLAFAGITTLYLAIAVPWEERSLVSSFGDEYRKYQQHVRWRIVPYVY